MAQSHRLVLTPSDLAHNIITYLETRNTPWRDEQSMREAVKETVRIMLTEARDETQALLREGWD